MLPKEKAQFKSQIPQKKTCKTHDMNQMLQLSMKISCMNTIYLTELTTNIFNSSIKYSIKFQMKLIRSLTYICIYLLIDRLIEVEIGAGI